LAPDPAPPREVASDALDLGHGLPSSTLDRNETVAPCCQVKFKRNSLMHDWSINLRD
jgi:hypothetical protein